MTEWVRLQVQCRHVQDECMLSKENGAVRGCGQNNVEDCRTSEETWAPPNCAGRGVGKACRASQHREQTLTATGKNCESHLLSFYRVRPSPGFGLAPDFVQILRRNF